MGSFRLFNLNFIKADWSYKGINKAKLWSLTFKLYLIFKVKLVVYFYFW